MYGETLQPALKDGLAVLVVEDEFLIAMDVEAILEDHGYVVLGPVGSVEEALRLLEEGRPDVAVLDVNLRGQLVFPVAKRLQVLNIPFVIASAYRSMKFDGAGAVSGAENIDKPIQERRLLEALSRASASLPAPRASRIP